MKPVIVFLFVNKHRLPYLLSCSAKTGSDSANRTFHYLCYLSHAHHIKIVKYYCLTLFVSESGVDNVHYYPAFFFAVGIIVRDKLAVGRIVDYLFRLLLRSAGIFPEIHFAVVYGNAVYPC